MITKYSKSSDPSCGDINGWIAKIKWQWNEDIINDPVADPNCNNQNQGRPDDITLPPLEPGCYYYATYIGGIIYTLDRSETTQVQTTNWDASFKCYDVIPIYNERRRAWEMGSTSSRCDISGYESNGSIVFFFQLEAGFQTAVGQLFKQYGTNRQTDYHFRARSEVNAARRFNTNIIRPGITSREYESCNTECARANVNSSFNCNGGCVQIQPFWISVYEVYLFCPGRVPELAYKNPDPCFNKEPESGSDRGEQNIVLPLGDKNRSSLWVVNGNTLSNGINNQTLTPPRANASLSVQFVFCGCRDCEEDCGDCCVDCTSVAIDIKEKLGLNNNNDPGSGN